MAVTGDSFCTSVWNGFILNLKYAAKFYFAQSIAAMFVFMGILFVTFANLGIGHVLISYVFAAPPSVVGVYVVFLIISFLIPFVCLGQFDEAVVATLMCYSFDTDMHHGDQKYGPKTYHEKLRAIEDQFDDGEKEERQRADSGHAGGAANNMA